MSTPHEASPVQPGQLLAGGKYRVDRLLGIGGMGVVVAATHVGLGQPVAIKFMLPAALGDRESVERFLFEGRSAAQLKSEHVARVLDVGTLENGAPYIVMEYLEGLTLDTFLEQGNALTVGEAVELVVQVCEAVAEAHARGIVHRDIKPTNLFLTRAADKRPLLKVIDFGLSKAIGPNSRKITKDFSVMGTPTYMSPEQLRSTADVDTRTDIWALGVVLYELLTGQVPFQADSIAEVCALVLGAPPRPIQEVFPDVPPELAAVITRCLQKDPDARFATVAELAEALDPFVPTGTATAGERIRRVQTASAIPASLTSQALVANAGRTEQSWGSDGMQMLGPQPSNRAWIALTAAVAVLGIAALLFGLRARSNAEAAAAAAATGTEPPPSLPNEPPPPNADPSAGTAGVAAASSETPTVEPPLASASPQPRPRVGPARPPRPHTTVPNRDKLLENR